MKRALVLLVLAACGRSGVSSSTDWSGGALGCGDFFVALLSKDKLNAVTLTVDRNKLQLGTGTSDVDVTKVDAKLDSFSTPLDGEYYCTDYGTGRTPSVTRKVGIGRLQVTIDHQPAMVGESYPVSIRLDDVDLGAGVLVPEMSGTNVSVGWFPG